MKICKLCVLVVSISVIAWASQLASDAQDAKTKRQPNLLVDASSGLINELIAQRVDRTEPTRETILDTPVTGISRTTGFLTAELLPDPSRANIDIVLRGQVYSQSVGKRPHVNVYANTTTPLEVRRRVIIDDKGIRSLRGPMFGDSRMEILDVNSGYDIDWPARRIAREAVYRSQAEAEAESTSKTVCGVADRLAQDLAGPLSDASKGIGAGLTRVKEAGLMLEQIDFNTTGSFLQARLRIATPGQKPPAYVPPMPDDIDLGIRVHDSLVNEAARVVYGGRSFKLEEVSKFYEEVTLGFLRDARKDVDQKDSLKTLEKLLATFAGKPTTITVAKDDPITVAFIDQGFTIDIHVATIQQADVTYAGSRVKATYAFENTRDGVLLVRKGAIRLTPLEPTGKQQKPTIALVTSQEILFSEVLKQRLILADVPMPDALAKVRLMQPRVGARDGWIGLAWNVRREPEANRR